MALLDNRDPERVPALIAALPAPIRRPSGADLERRDLSRLPFDLILCTGAMIRSSVHRKPGACCGGTGGQGVAVPGRPPCSRRAGLAGVLDGFELWQAIYRVLAERDALPAPDLERCLPE